MTARRAAADITKICATCGELFTLQAAYAWQADCTSCYRGVESKGATIARLEGECMKLEAENIRLRQMAERLLGRPKNLGQHRWRQVMGLIHPDRHGGSASSNDAAAWLLSVRSEFGA